MNFSAMRELSFGMSNFDGAIADGLATALQAEPAQVFGRHAGWSFNGKVYFADGQFHEAVWCYGSLQGTISAPTLRELMIAVCDVYGYE